MKKMLGKVHKEIIRRNDERLKRKIKKEYKAMKIK